MKNFLISICVLCIFFGTGCSLIRQPEVTIVDAKIVTGFDANLMPVKVTDVFSSQTSKVGCWIQWQDAKVNTQLVTKWHYLTDDIHILDHVLDIPKKDGTGGVMLNMPEGRSLPSGIYKVELFLGKRLLRSLRFKVEKAF